MWKELLEWVIEMGRSWERRKGKQKALLEWEKTSEKKKEKKWGPLEWVQWWESG